MDSIMSLDIGLLFWTLLIFGILVFILKKFGLTAIINSLDTRENNIKNSKKNRDIVILEFVNGF